MPRRELEKAIFEQINPQKRLFSTTDLPQRGNEKQCGSLLWPQPNTKAGHVHCNEIEMLHR